MPIISYSAGRSSSPFVPIACRRAVAPSLPSLHLRVSIRATAHAELTLKKRNRRTRDADVAKCDRLRPVGLPFGVHVAKEDIRVTRQADARMDGVEDEGKEDKRAAANDGIASE